MKNVIKKIIKPKNKVLRGWRNLIVAGIIIALVYIGFNMYIESFTFYSFSHLTPTSNNGPMIPFSPIRGESVPDMVRAAENDILALYINTYDSTIAVYDKRNGYVWHSNPPSGITDPLANSFERNAMRSLVGLSFFNHRHREFTRWSYNDSVAFEQHEIFTIPNGIVIRYLMGSQDLGIHALPRLIERERFQERVLDQIVDDSDRNWVRRGFTTIPDMPEFVRMQGDLRSGLNAQRLIRIFDEIGYTYEELEYDNLASGYEPEFTLDLFVIYVELMLDGDSLIFNVPVDQIEVQNERNVISNIEIMRFFGAASVEDDGFILIPNGSGALIEFNNNKAHEERFRAPMYGFDFLTTSHRPQIMQPVRFPLVGINKGHSAMLAMVENGAGLASLTADVSGRFNSFNYAWFSFTLRSTMQIGNNLPGDQRVNSMNVIQDYAYLGDISVRYQFIVGDDINIADMANAYRNTLINQGVISRIENAGDRTFYLDVIGAVDVREVFMGVPHMTEMIMTSFSQANYLVDMFEDEGITNIQMMLHGWFNGGINHHVAKNVNRIRGLGTVDEMRTLNDRLQANGGALNPVVNFAITNFDSRNFNPTFEVARDVSGMLGIMSRVSREFLTTRFSRHNNDWFFLVHPRVLPGHVTSFMDAYNSAIGLSNLALADLGDILTESAYLRNNIDREHSRLIAQEQIARLSNEYSNIIIFGGNDYSIRYASHLVDVPTRADWFYIIDHEVPFFQMVFHGYIEFAGASINTQPNPNVRSALLTSMATGAAPRFTLTYEPTRMFQFSPHERLYSTQYIHWLETAINYYHTFNNVHRYLKAESIVHFEILSGTMGSNVTVTEFSNGTRIYVNNTRNPYQHQGKNIPPLDFVVVTA